MFLPIYLPDLNLTEFLFAKLKQKLKLISAAILDELSLASHNTLEQVGLQDLIDWFRHAGCVVY